MFPGIGLLQLRSGMARAGRQFSTTPTVQKHTRKILSFNQDAPIFSGSLATLLPQHASMRASHFFRFCVNVQMGCDVLERLLPAFDLTPSQAIEFDRATHQAGVGHRVKGAPAFNKTSDDIGQELATGVSHMDAAHFNNLGLKPDFLKPFNTLIKNSNGDLKTTLQTLQSYCVVYCSDTRLLPQRVNLKSEKILDDVHREVARNIFSNPDLISHPLISEFLINYYINYANTRIDGSFTADEKKTPMTPDCAMTMLYKPGYSDVKANLYDQLWPGVAFMIDEINQGLPPGIEKLEYDDYIGPGSTAGKPRSPEIQAMIDSFRDTQNPGEGDQRM